MDTTTISTVLGLGAQTVGTILQSYVTFKKSNVERYFELLLNENKDLSSIGENEQLQRHFYYIIDCVAREVVEDKIRNWKNLTVKLASSLTVDDFAENVTKTLEDLTAFDLMVLTAIYATEYENKYFQAELKQYFERKNIRTEYIDQSLKRIARNNLVSEVGDGATFLTDDEAFGQAFLYCKNELGRHFIKVIADHE